MKKNEWLTAKHFMWEFTSRNLAFLNGLEAKEIVEKNPLLQLFVPTHFYKFLLSPFENLISEIISFL